MTLKVKSYTGIDTLSFDNSTKNDAFIHYGSPVSERVTQNNRLEYEYPNFILRFDINTSKLIEYTLLPYAQAAIKDIVITWDKSFLKKLCLIDGAPKNSYGFIVLSKLGLAITGIHDDDTSQLAITVFRQKELEEFLEGSNNFDTSSL